MPSVYVTATDAAYCTGAPVGTIWRWASEGRIGRTGKGKAARYSLFDMHKCQRDPATREVVEPGQLPPLPAGAKAARARRPRTCHRTAAPLPARNGETPHTSQKGHTAPNATRSSG
jgi:hypothetical protein